MKNADNPQCLIAQERMAGTALGQPHMPRGSLVLMPNSNDSMYQPKYTNAVARVVNHAQSACKPQE
jgi:hypothetical protein